MGVKKYVQLFLTLVVMIFLSCKSKFMLTHVSHIKKSGHHIVLFRIW